jgi:hypothetical protein
MRDYRRVSDERRVRVRNHFTEFLIEFDLFRCA